MSTSRVRVTKAAFAVFALSLCGCGEPAKTGDDGLDGVRGAIDNGQVETGYPAVGIVYLDYPNLTPFCTGTLIGPQTVLTAAHCITNSGTHQIAFSAGRVVDADAFDHWSADQALLHLSSPITNVTPLTVAAGSPPPVGTQCTIVGYGEHLEPNGTFSFGRKRSATVRITAVGNTIQTQEVTGLADNGDSGGPLLCNGQIVGTASFASGATYPYCCVDYTPTQPLWINDFNRPVGSPVVISTASGPQMKVFLHGSDDQLWRQDFNGSTWLPPQPMGGVLIGSPGVVSWGGSRIDVFARGTDNGLYQDFADGGDFTGFGRLGNYSLGADPTAISTGVGLIDVFFRDSQGHVTNVNWNGSTWSSVVIPSSTIEDRVSPVIYQGVVHAFWRTPTAKIGHSWKTGPTTWAPAEILQTTASASGSPSALVWGSNRLTVFFRDAVTGQLDQLEKTPPVWTLNTFTGKMAGSPSAVASGSGNNHVNVFVLTPGDTISNAWFDGSWHGLAQLSNTVISGSPAAVAWGSGAVKDKINAFLRGATGTLSNEWWDGHWHGVDALGSTFFP